MSNVGVIKALEHEGINVVLTDVGDKFVLREMKKNDYILGGENSGHIILRSFLDTGDGLLIALYILKIVTDQQTTLSALTKNLSMWPQVMKNISVSDKTILALPNVRKAIESVKDSVGNEGKVLVRPSGTEPVVRVTISCKTQTEIEKHMHTIVEQIKEAQ
jgi:phosphoglucosamine mutase